MPQTNNDFDVLVLGAGVVGINTAYWNLKNGKSVCVLDRQPAAGLETSFANGGQVSVSHEPWANPSAPLKILKWLFDSDAPLLFRPRLELSQWIWIVQFLFDCFPWRADYHTMEILRIATQSRTLIKEIRQRENLQYDSRSSGILHFYRDGREFEHAIRVANRMRNHGWDNKVVSVDEVVALEPAFAENKHKIVGATFTQEDESGDAFKFTQGLAKRCAELGANFMYCSEVVALHQHEDSDTIKSVELRTPDGYRNLMARDIVVCMGSYSAELLRPLGIRLNIYPAKGYSVTIPIGDTNKAPVRSLTDDQYKLVYSNFGDRLRVAGTAELSGYTKHLNYSRCQGILNNVRALFPRAGNFQAATFWTGLRPATPSNLPYVGRTRYRNLWLNTGHGTLGWTMGAGTGFVLAEMIRTGEAQVIV